MDESELMEKESKSLQKKKRMRKIMRLVFLIILLGIAGFLYFYHQQLLPA